MDMPLFSLGSEGKVYFEDSHVRLRTMSPKDLDRKRNLGILPHLLKRFSAIPESGYPVQPFHVWIAKKHRPLPAGWLNLGSHLSVHREEIRSSRFRNFSFNHR